MIKYVDREGNLITDTLTWARMYEDENYRRVALDRVGGVRVSTVWQGFDTRHPDAEHPEVFEIQVALWSDEAVEKGMDPKWVEYERFSTEASALAAHNDIVQMLKFIGNDELPEDWRPSWQG